MTPQRSFYERNGLWITVLGIALFPFVFWAAVLALAGNLNEVKDWLPEHYNETADYDWFRKHFGNDVYAIATWEGCTLVVERLDRLEERLTAKDRSGFPFARVVTGRSALRETLASNSAPTRDEAIVRLKGSLIGPDGRQTCAVIHLGDGVRDELQATLDGIRRDVEACGVPADDVRMGGAPVLNAAIDRVSLESLVAVVAATFITVISIAWLVVRDVRLIVLVLATGIYSSTLSLAVLWLCGSPMNAIMVAMIPMVYVTATSGAIHLCNYYLAAVGEGGVEGAAGRAIAHAWVPLGLATATTAAGLLSICYNDLVLIQRFGIFSAVGVALSWVLLVAWLPSALTAWKPRRPVVKAARGDHDETGEAPLSASWLRLGDAVTRRPNLLTAACMLVLAFCAAGLPKVDVTIDLMKEFMQRERVIQDYVWLEKHLGPLSSLEVVLRFDAAPSDAPGRLAERLRLVDRLEKRYAGVEFVGSTISAATFVKPPEVKPGAWLQTGFANTRIEKERGRLEKGSYLAKGDGEELWRVTVRVTTMQELNFDHLVADLQRATDAELDELSAEDRTGIATKITGVAPVLFKARNSLVEGLVWGVVTDLVLIVVTITVLMRHWSSGVAVMLTSLFPTFIVLGTIGWLGIVIDLGAIMAPCVALGVTVDDVIHFLLWFRTGVRQGRSRRDSVLLAWRACVRPMYQSWSLLGLGMSTLALSAFIPILQFGAIMVSMLTVGLLGNLFLLPSLLAGSLGGIIEARCRREMRRRSEDSAEIAATSAAEIPAVSVSRE